MSSPLTLGTDPGHGIAGIGATLQGAVSGAICMITKINIEGVECGELDVTTMNSPDKFSHFIANLKDAKSITINMLYHKSNMSHIQARVAKPNENWVITFPDGSTFTQLGYISMLGNTQIAYNDKISQDMKLRMSGAPVFVEGTSSGGG